MMGTSVTWHTAAFIKVTWQITDSQRVIILLISFFQPSKNTATIKVIKGYENNHFYPW